MSVRSLGVNQHSTFREIALKLPQLFIVDFALGMEQEIVLGLARSAIIVTIKISLPILVAALIVGLTISLMQAMTQIQEQSLVFVPKFFTILLLLMLMTTYIAKILGNFSDTLFAIVAQG